MSLNFVSYVKSVRSVLLSGTIIRLLFAPFTGHPYDLPIWLESGELIADGISPYTPTDHLGQTILWALWTGLSYIISSAIPWGDPYIYIFLIKLLPILGDICAMYLVLLILEEHTQVLDIVKHKRYTFILYFNPVLIFGSSFWAMSDSLALVCILSAYRYTRDNSYIKSVISLSLAISLKLYPVILLPPFFIYSIRRKQRFKQAILYGISTITLFFFIAYIPFIIFQWDIQEISGVLESQTKRNIGGLSPIGFFTISMDSHIFQNISPRVYSNLNRMSELKFVWGITSIVMTSIILIKHFEKKLTNIDELDEFLSMSILFYTLWILSATWVSEQNFIPLIGLLSLRTFYKIENSSLQGLKNYFDIIMLSTMVCVHILLNVPLNRFFYLILDNTDDVFQNEMFVEFRAFTLSVIIILTTLFLVRLCYKFYRNISAEAS